MPLLMCPNCNAGMREVDRQGIRIDICPQCRGVWLDRGELELLLRMDAEGAFQPSSPSSYAPAAPPPPMSGHQQPYGHDQGRGHHGKHESYHGPHQGQGNHPRKKSSLKDLFDIFD